MRIVIFILSIVLSISHGLYSQSKTIVIIYNQQDETSRFAAAEMKKNLESSKYAVTLSNNDSKNLAAGYRFYLTVRSELNAGDYSDLPAISSQAYSIRGKKESGSAGSWYIIGADKRGMIYGALDASETVMLNGFEALKPVDKTPYINNRGIKFNIPLDARTPSYSDNADAAQQNIINMWDTSFWHPFLDEMVRNRFNMLSLWSLSPFPSLVDVPEYPKAGLNDVMRTTALLIPTTDATFMSTPASLEKLVVLKKITLKEKIKFWQHIMEYASVRGIDCYLFTWNLFVYGTESSGYGFTDSLTDSKTKDYIRKATGALVKTYPLLKGIGLTAGENMMRQTEVAKEKFLYDSYGEGINDALKEDPSRVLQLIHRAHQADIDMIKKTFSGLNTRCRLDFSYKYSVAQMYSSVAPQYIYDSKFLDHIGDSKFYLTVRDDSWYNLRGGSDPGFARGYFTNIPKKNFEGFYVGPDGYTWGRDYLSKAISSPRQLIINKRWYCFRLLGKLAFDPETPDSYFTNLLQKRFPEADAPKMAKAWALGSSVIPMVNRFHNGRSQNDFQWYPEGCTSFYGFKTINSFISCTAQKGEGLVSIPDYVKAIAQHQSPVGVTPVELATKLQATGDSALLLIKNIQNVQNKEFKETISDIRAMAYLGQYYAEKILGAVNKQLFLTTQSSSYKDSAIKHLKIAATNWQKYATEISGSYIPQHMTRMHYTVDFKNIQAHVDKEVVMMTKMELPKNATEVRQLNEELEVVFAPNSKYYFWHWDKIGMKTDWSAFKYLVVEVHSTTGQPFDLFIRAGNDTLVHKNLKPKGAYTVSKMVIPLSSFQLRNTGAVSKANAADRVFALNEVTDLGLSMEKPSGLPILELRSFTLSNQGPESGAAVASRITNNK